MKRLVAILALLAVVLTACGSNTTPAATVDGRIITVGDVESFMAEDTGAADVPTFSEFLAAAIQLDILFTSAEEQYGVAPTDVARGWSPARRCGLLADVAVRAALLSGTRVHVIAAGMPSAPFENIGGLCRAQLALVRS